MSSLIRLDKGELPWPPLVPGGDGLNRFTQPSHLALRRRMADIYGVHFSSVWPAPGVERALAWIDAVEGPLTRYDHPDMMGELIDALPLAPAVIVEERIEFADGNLSFATRAAETAGLYVIRSLDISYGLAGAGGIAAIIASPAKIDVIESTGWAGLPTLAQHLAEKALAPERALATAARIELVKAERERLRTALGCAASAANFLIVHDADPRSFAQLGIDVDWLHDWNFRKGESARITIGTRAENDLVLAAMGVPVPLRQPHRTATIARDTKETRIVASVDLDRAGAREVHTGVGFFDHMLDQVAAHGGFGLSLAVEGDLHIDPHHSIEDATLALGAALKQALGDRAGIGRYGFVLPMDEAEARISIDLGGRPFSVFEGKFHASHIGAYPTALTAHVFRSLAESMGAAIHVHVTGEDDHHKTEACFKALGRALRQAIRVEGGDVPSTKGVI